jgi:P27 family predicted phage terminase small subunit
VSRARWLAHPEGLSPAALPIWKYYAPGLYEAGTLTPENAESLRSLCEILAIMRAAAAEIARDGVVIGTPSGAKKSNPACAVLFQAQKTAAQLLKQFGLAL